MVKSRNLNILPTILLFVYNRVGHLKSTISSLKKNKNYNKYEIFIFCDGPKNNLDKKKVNEVINEIKKIKGFKKKKYFIQKKNVGLANSIINGINSVFKIKKINSVIVLEDDLNFNSNFLEYMSNALSFYKDDKNIGSISGYSFFNKNPQYQDKIYLSPRHSSWGWGTWKNRWDKFVWDKKWVKKKYLNKKIRKKIEIGGKDLPKILKKQIDGEIDSWSIIFDLNCAIHKLYCLCPNKSLVLNIGLDNSGTHCKYDGGLNLNFDKNYKVEKFYKLKINYQIVKDIQKLFNISYYQRVKNKIKKLLM